MADGLIVKDSYKKLLQRALRYCAGSEQCEADVRGKLAQWGASSAEVDAVVRRLKQGDYINERRYVRYYCENKVLSQHWGRQKVEYGLRQKGISRDLATEGMTVVNPEDYSEVLAKTAQTKLDTLTPADEWTLRTKLTAFLAQRGFLLPEISEALDNLDFSQKINN